MPEIGFEAGRLEREPARSPDLASKVFGTGVVVPLEHTQVLMTRDRRKLDEVGQLLSQAAGRFVALIVDA